MSEPKLIDILEGKKTLIEGLLDGKGSVQLVDVSPRLVPEGYTAEFAAVRAARTSYGAGLKDPLTDEKLLRYLVVNWHTSPLEMVNCTWRLRLPLSICVHFLRHRMFKFNQESFRYSEVPETENFYDPLKFEEGIREGCKLNKQSSSLITDEKKIEEITNSLTKANELVKELHEVYHKLIKQGLSKEVARFYLPNSEYTTIYIQTDLNNLAKMLTLRMAGHSQRETQIYANAMFELVKPLFPVTMKVLEERMNGFSLITPEIEVLKSEKSIDSISSISEKKALKEKAEILGIKL